MSILDTSGLRGIPPKIMVKNPDRAVISGEAQFRLESRFKIPYFPHRPERLFWRSDLTRHLANS